MEKRVVGPALKSTVKNQGKEWTTAWIKNNQALRDAGDKHANDIFKEYNGIAMPAYEHLGDESIGDIVEYLAQYSDKKAELAAKQPAPAAGQQQVIVQSGGLSVLEIVLLTLMIALLLGVIGILYWALKQMSEAYRKSRATELYLIKKDKKDLKGLNEEFDEFIEDEVNKRVKTNTLKFKNEIELLLKRYFK